MKNLSLVLFGFSMAAAGVISVAGAEVPPSYLATWGSLGSGPGQFSQPFGIAIDNNLVYIADQLNERVQVLTTSGAFVREWPTGPVDNPTGLAVGPSGTVYVAMHNTHVVNMYSSTGAFLGQIGSPGTSPGQLLFPVGIATDASGNVYVADSENNRIQKFAAGGAFLLGWGGVTRPYGIAINATGNVYVTGRDGYEVRVFDSSGLFITAWGSSGSGAGQFVATDGMDFDAAGNLFVVDSGTNSRVGKFTAAGAFLTQWGSFGSQTGQFTWPADVAVDGNGYVYVTDWFNNRVQVFGAGATPTKSTTWGRLKAMCR